MLKYIAVRQNSSTNSTTVPPTRQRQTVREAAVNLAFAKRSAHQHSIGMGGSNGRRVLAAMNRSMGSHFQ